MALVFPTDKYSPSGTRINLGKSYYDTASFMIDAKRAPPSGTARFLFTAPTTDNDDG